VGGVGAVIRQLPSIIFTALLFAFVGTALGALIYLTIAGTAAGKPWLALYAFKDLDMVLGLAIMFGAIPSAITGVVGRILRIHLRSLRLVVCLMAPVGAGLSAIYAFAIFGFRDVSPLLEWIGLTGGASAVCCSLLFLRSADGPAA
jgi:hypothetical protein